MARVLPIITKRRRRHNEQVEESMKGGQVQSSAYDLFSYPPLDLSTEQSFEVTYRPIQTGTNPILFQVTEHNDFTDLANSFMEFLVQVKDADGGNMTNGNGWPCNNMLHTMIKQLTFTINGTIVTPQNNQYAYNAYIENLLNYSAEQKDSILENSVWAKDTAGQMETLDAAQNKGLANRNFFNGGAQYLLSGVPLIDVFKTDRYLPPQTKLEMAIDLNSDEFIFMPGDSTGGNNAPSAASKKPTLKILASRFTVRQVVPTSETREKILKILSHTPAIYPLIHSRIETATIAAGLSTQTFDNVFQGKIPNNLIIGMVHQNAYTGKYYRNPFNFQKFHLSGISVRIDGKEVAPYSNTLTGAYYDRGYRSLFFENGNAAMTGPGSDIERSDFSQGYSLFRFNLLPSKGGTHHWRESVREGNLVVTLNFSTPTAGVVQVLFRGEFYKTMSIDADGNTLYV